MLLRIAQGDAYAACVEYVKEAENPGLYEWARRFEQYLQHPTHTKLRPGMYTDDTQMSIALTEVLLAKGRSAKHEDFIEAWFNAFKRDPRDGYSRNFQAILESVKSGDELRLTLKPDSTKNGAAMRSVPLGTIADPEWVKMMAMRQAGTTHATYEGVTASVAVALMSHFALYDRRDFPSMTGWLANQLPAFERFREPWVGPVTGKAKHSPWDVGMNTAWAVHTLLTTQPTLMGIMRQVIEWGGDTDSVAAIAWGIASARCQDEVLPDFLERDLEATGNLKYGPEFLKDLGKRLMEAPI
jgi:ADP-ribosylglycohydrolase